MNLIRIAWIAVRELLYERAFYVLLCFAMLSLGLSLLLGQMTYAEQYKLTLDFMLGGMEISMVIFSIFAGISLFQKEMQSGSVSMTLAKPISRTTFLLGKYVGQCAVQMVILVSMACITIAVTSTYGHPAVGAIFQTSLLIGMEISILTAITYFFAVNAGATTTAIACLCLYGMGHLRETISRNGDMFTSTYGFWKFFKTLVPDLEVFNTKNVASYGQKLTNVELGWVSLYALLCISLYLICASITFERKDILT